MNFNHRLILRTISIIVLLEGIAMIFPMILAIVKSEIGPASAFFFVAICCIGFGMVGYRYMQFFSVKIKPGESFFIAFISWLVVCLIGTLPYLYCECGYTFADAVFESFSGWTTTGAWVIPFDTLPDSIVLWKAITNWLGGMGLILLAISFFPVLGAEGQKIASAETPGTKFEKFSAKTSMTAVISYCMYIVMSMVEFLLLLASDLSPIEALVNTMSTISTAGLLNLNNCITLHLTPYVKLIFTIFSILGSLNYLLYFYLCTGKWRTVLKNVEMRTYLSIILVATLAVTACLCLSGQYTSVSDALVDSFSQSVSYSSTSGFEVADINVWPTFAKLILFTLMLIGGCGNSTSGSIKVIRVIIYFKIIMRGVYKRIHPRAVKPIMLNGSPVSSEIASSVSVFILLYFALFVFASILFSFENRDMETTFFTALACLTNNGTGFGGIIGGDFSQFSNYGRYLSAILMLAGRLEIYSIIMLFSPSFWNPNRAKS